MTVATELLSYEHGILRQVIDPIKEAAETHTLDKYRTLLGEVTNFLGIYLDQFHHVKEELFLFPVAIQASESLRSEIPKLIREHQQAWELLDQMDSAIKANAMDRFSESSLALVEHMTSHIDREERSVFPSIEAHLTPALSLDIKSNYVAFNAHFGPEFYHNSENFARKVEEKILGPQPFEGKQ